MPSRVIAVATPRRQREGANDGVETHCLKERGRLDLADDLVLLADVSDVKPAAPLTLACARRFRSAMPSVYSGRCAALNVASARSMKERAPACAAPGRPSTAGRIRDVRAETTSAWAGVNARVWVATFADVCWLAKASASSTSNRSAAAHAAPAAMAALRNALRA